MCAHSITYTPVHMGLNTCTHDVHTCEGRHGYPYTGLGIHIWTLLYPATEKSTHAHICTQAQCMHMFTQESTYVHDHKASHMYRHRFLCTFTHESPLSHSGKSTVHPHSHMSEDTCMYRHAARQEWVCLYTRACYTQAWAHTYTYSTSKRTWVYLVVSPQSHASRQHASVPTVVLWLLPDSPARKARLPVLLQDGRHEAEVDGAVRDGHVSFGQEPQVYWLRPADQASSSGRWS